MNWLSFSSIFPSSWYFSLSRLSQKPGRLATKCSGLCCHTCRRLILSLILFFQYRSGADLEKCDESLQLVLVQKFDSVWRVIFN